MDMDSDSAAVTRGRCRACLQKDVDVVALSVTVCVFAEEVTLSQMLNTCCAVEVSASDLKPQTLCNHCAKSAELSFTFRKICQNADIRLQDELDGVNVKFEPTGVNINIELDELIIKEDHEDDDRKSIRMVPTKDELANCVSISYNDDLKQLQTGQNTSNIEKPLCKICQTHFADWLSLEHHLENCYRRICGVCGQTFTSANALSEHTRTHKILSTDKKVILKRVISKCHKCRFCKMSYKFPAELRNHAMTHVTVKHYLCIYCGNKFSLSHRSKCKQTHSQHSRKHINKKMIDNNKARDNLKPQPRFGCSVCNKSYSQQISLMNHKCLHCLYCNKRFNLTRDLKSHIVIHTGKKPYECSYCKKQFTRLGSLKQHERIHSSEKCFKCSHCSKRCATQAHLTTHERTHTGEKPYKCSHCSKRFKHQSALTLHERSHTDGKPYECSQCSTRFLCRRALTSHEFLHTGEKPYECSYCKKRFTREHHLKSHERVHTGEKPYQCIHCNKRFTHNTSLKNHILIHTGENPYVCSHCSKSFGSQTGLTEHIRTHTGEKPYECSYCKKRFTRRGSLISHKLTHTGEKRHECSYCKKRFTHLGQLNSHKLTHTGEKPHECSYCKKRFAHLGSLNSHKLTHTGEKPYQCSDCSKRFTHVSSLKWHKRIHTG